MGRYIFLVGLSLHLVWSQPEDINFKVAISSCNQSPSCKNSLKEAVADFTQSLYADMAKTSKQENFVFSPLRLDFFLKGVSTSCLTETLINDHGACEGFDFS